MPANCPKPCDDDEPDNPALSRIIERNIRTIIRLRLKAALDRGLQDRAADAITSFSGNMVFIYLHVAWFSIWVLLNTGRFGVHPFDPFPYGLLTMVVSLEAIFLSALVLITQNRMTDEVERRADLALHMGLLTEHELTRVPQMLDAALRFGAKPPDRASSIDRQRSPARRLILSKSAGNTSLGESAQQKSTLGRIVH